MKNVDAVAMALEAEIEHARQGLEYYKSRVETLEQMLRQLRKFETTHQPAARGKKGAPMLRSPEQIVKEILAPGRGRRGRPAPEVASQELPYTGGDYWYDLVSSTPHTAAEILKMSIDSLGFEPTREQVHKLRLRVVAALNALVASKRIKDSGSGRDRRYFK